MSNNNVVQYVQDMTATVVNSMVRLQEINGSMIQKLAQHQLTAANDLMASSSKQLQEFSAVNNPSEVVGKQADLAKEWHDKIFSHAKQTMDLLMSTNTELHKMMEQNLNNISESFSKNVSGIAA
ncbi:MAG: phasin family protein [Magnetococcales bacterium]|nr:phasin family protein [Magnetococcales bacterium]